MSDFFVSLTLLFFLASFGLIMVCKRLTES